MPAPRPIGNVARNVVNVNIDWDVLDIDIFLAIHYQAALAGHEDIMRLCHEGIDRNIAAVRTQEKLLADRLTDADALIADYTVRRKAAS